MSKTKKTKSRKQVKRSIVVCVLMLIASGLFIIVCGLLTDNGYGSIWWPTIGLIGAFSCLLIGIKAVSTCFSDAMSYESEDKQNRFGLIPLTLLDIKANSVDGYLKQKGFQVNEYDYLHKKKATLFKGEVNVYARSMYINEFSLDNITKKIKDNRVNPNNALVILFEHVPCVNEDDLLEFKSISTEFATIAIAPFSNKDFTTIHVLVDQSTNKAYFLAIKIANLTIYEYGCKYIKKLFK